MSIFDILENFLFEVTVNPILKRIMSLIDKDSPRDGDLFLGSLGSFLGEPVCLCPFCSRKRTKMADRLYRLGSRFLGMDRDFMRYRFLDDQFGQAWFRGFGLMVKGVEKYGVRIPFTSQDLLKSSGTSLTNAI